MNLGKYLKKILAPALKENGYEFVGKESSVSWKFIKDDEYQKIIAFQKSQLEKNSFKVTLATKKIPKKPPVNLHWFNQENGSKVWWEYDDSSVETVLSNVRELIFEFGIPYLEAVVKPDLEPSVSLHNTLIEKAGILAGEFNRTMGLSVENPDYVKVIRDQLLEQMKKCNSPDWDYILMASAAVGEYIIKQHGGKWGWSEYYQGISVISNIGEMDVENSPLLLVSHFWGKPDVFGYDLYDEYLKLKNFVSGGI